MTDPTDPDAPRPWPYPAPQSPVAPEPAGRPRTSWAGDAPLQFSSPEEDRSRRRNAIIGIAVVLAAAIGFGTYFLFFDGDAAPPRVTLPTSFPGYREITSARLQQVENQLRERLAHRAGGATRTALESATVSTYAPAPTGVPGLIVVTFSTSALHTSADSYDVTDQMFSYLHPNNRVYPAGPAGGSVRCGPIRTAGIRLAACAWSDATTTGAVTSIDPAIRPADLASTVNDLRGRIGRPGAARPSGSDSPAIALPPNDVTSSSATPTGPPASARRIAAPSSFGHYEQVRGPKGRQAVQRVRAGFSGSDPRAAAFRDAKIALYERSPGAPQLLFLGNDVRNDTVRSMIQEESPSHDTLNFLAGLGATSIVEYPAGPLGGSLRCGAPGRFAYPTCAWIDGSSLGWVIEYGTGAPRRLAVLTRQLRGAAEH